MVDAIQFHNFRILRNATLPLGRITVIVGPNGSGKSTALQGLERISESRGLLDRPVLDESLRTVGTGEGPFISLLENNEVVARLDSQANDIQAAIFGTPAERAAIEWRRRIRVFSLSPSAIARPVSLRKTLELSRDGEGLAAVLTNLQDQYPERFEKLNVDLHRWMPDFDRVLMDTPTEGMRSFLLRTTQEKHRISSVNVSDGTLLSLAMLTLSYLPEPPSLIGLEEPDRGIHPRLLRDVQDALFRLANPEAYGEGRDPVRVVLTTHSPYFIDLFRDYPEDIVIAQKEGLYATFKRLVDLPNVEEILRDAHLGEAWYSGALGGVPTGT